MSIRMDITHIPFSRYGAMLSISKTQGKNELVVHDVQQRFGADWAFCLYIVPENFELEGICRGETFGSMPFQASASPACLTVTCGNKSLRACVLGDHRMAFHAEGMTLLLLGQTKNGYGIAKDERHYELLYANEWRYGFIVCNQGSLTAHGPLVKHYDRMLDAARNVKIMPEQGVIDMEIEIGQTEVRQDPLRTWEQSMAETEREWQLFLKKMPPVPWAHREFAQVGWFNLWSSFVRAQGNYQVDVILMNKKYMTSFWSWDHCFNALAIAYADRDQALDQFFAPFMNQNESGVLMDLCNPGLGISWAITKPPIHGWCFSKLMDRFDLDKATLRQAYNGLEKWTNWWLNYRDEDGDGIPEYPQGCDSGWDNATIFDKGFFVESADLSAFLALQMRCMARIAGELGDSEQQRQWAQKADQLVSRMLEHFWNGKEFVPQINGTHIPIEGTGCLLNDMPVVLGELLPREIADIVVKNMLENNLTENGLATEAPESALYESDGYWRGPIWAPSTYLIVDGLSRMGRKKEAGEIARRFVDMCAFKAKGHYENYDALTGIGLRAPGYTWTASVYLCLLWEYCMDAE